MHTQPSIIFQFCRGGGRLCHCSIDYNYDEAYFTQVDKLEKLGLHSLVCTTPSFDSKIDGPDQIRSLQFKCRQQRLASRVVVLAYCAI